MIYKELNLGLIAFQLHVAEKILFYYIGDELTFSSDQGFGVKILLEGDSSESKLKMLSNEELVSYFRKAKKEKIQPWIEFKEILVEKENNLKKDKV